MSNETHQSFEDITNELNQPIFRYLKRMVGNSADADELLQETLIRIARGLPQFEQKSSIKTWAFRIATNVTIDFFRKSQKTTIVEFQETDEPSNEDKDDKLVIDEMNQCIRNVIDSLPPDYRAVLVLYKLEGYSIEETARICEISIPTAKIRIHRAKIRLREAMEKACDFYQSADGNLRCDKKLPKNNG